LKRAQLYWLAGVFTFRYPAILFDPGDIGRGAAYAAQSSRPDKNVARRDS
jgi:hypothetical protein